MEDITSFVAHDDQHSWLMHPLCTRYWPGMVVIYWYWPQEKKQVSQTLGPKLSILSKLPDVGEKRLGSSHFQCQ